MLGADINTIDPESIIDTEMFIQSLRKEFEGVVQRTMSGKIIWKKPEWLALSEWVRNKVADNL